MFMYAHDWMLKSFPVSAALTYIFRGVYALTRRCRNTKGEPMVPFYQRLFEPTYLLLIYHIATLTTSLRVVLRDYSSSPKTNLNVYQGLTCNTRYPLPFCLYTPFVYFATTLSDQLRLNFKLFWQQFSNRVHEILLSIIKWNFLIRSEYLLCLPVLIMILKPLFFWILYPHLYLYYNPRPHLYFILRSSSFS